MDLSPDIGNEVELTLAALEEVTLPKDLWQRVSRLLRELESALVSSQEASVRGALIPLEQIVFEAKIGGRTVKSRSNASVVIPTKSTPVLPLVGAVCAAILLLLAWMLGGGLILLATGALAALVMVVAISGSQSRRHRSMKPNNATGKAAIPEVVPPRILTLLHTIRTKINE